MAPISAYLPHYALPSKREILLSRSILQGSPAPPAPTASSNDGWSPSAIIFIVAAIVIIVISVPLITIIIRRYKRKRCFEVVSEVNPNGLDSSQSSVRKDQSLKSILVTHELQRSSLRVSLSGKKPEEPDVDERAWSQTEIRGGDWR
ncbi:hypothetical protein BDU57DRAFT_510564 [Ampelomyces quisqualis]|uniref:Uncharacterized protein n=1 Tax=Ampelomyces quisqualis TaxID=50730 RepID=A0A6A5R3Q5_AMPQU|nr:hypothetical protein BDU57DRAFT_510564 [Ampelomyces quisqualis]